MDFQLLLSTMHRDDWAVLDERSITSNVVVINQCNQHSIQEETLDERRVLWLNTNNRGIGVSRNTALLYSKADIVLFADDDIDYVENYEQLILEEFSKHPDADGIFFNLSSSDKERAPHENTAFHRVHFWNGLKYGAPRFAVKRSALLKERISFSQLFGGGAPYSCGEDTLFVVDCLKRGLKLYASPLFLGQVHFESSSWFKGYDEKYFTDKGAAFYSISKRLCKLLCLQDLMRHQNQLGDLSLYEAYGLMKRGVEAFKARDTFAE